MLSNVGLHVADSAAWRAACLINRPADDGQSFRTEAAGASAQTVHAARPRPQDATGALPPVADATSASPSWLAPRLRKPATSRAQQAEDGNETPRCSHGVLGDRAMAELAMLMAKVAAQARRVNHEYVAQGLAAQRHAADVQANKAASAGYAQLGGALAGGLALIGGVWRSGSIRCGAYKMPSDLGRADPALQKQLGRADMWKAAGEAMSGTAQNGGRTGAATLEGEKVVAQSEGTVAGHLTNVENDTMSRNLGDIQRWLDSMMQYLSARLQTNAALAANMRV